MKYSGNVWAPDEGRHMVRLLSLMNVCLPSRNIYIATSMCNHIRLSYAVAHRSPHSFHQGLKNPVTRSTDISLSS